LDRAPGWWPTQILLAIGIASVAVIGLAWMIRIFRGIPDEPPPWRHRAR
jgi:hypothetical protein